MTERAVMTYWRPPFSDGAVRQTAFDASLTLAEIVERAAFLRPYAFNETGTIMLAGADGREHVLPRAQWARTRVKPGHAVTLHVHLSGGAGGEGRRGKAGGLVAIAALILATVVSAGALAPAFGAAFSPVGIGAKALAAGIALAGSLAASALTPPPARADALAQAQDQSSAPASISGNVLQPGGYIPRVLGRDRWVFPPLLTQPFTWRDGDNEYVEAVYGLAGPHSIDAIRVGDAAIEDMEGIDYEVKEGWPDDGPLTLVTRYAAVRNRQAEMAAHRVDPDSASKADLENQVTPSASLPQWHLLRAPACDEIRIDLIFAEGLWNQDSANEVQGVAFRIQFRADGETDWVNGPQLHFHANSSKPVKPSIVIRRGAGPDALPNPPRNEGWVLASKAVPGQSAGGVASDGWDADAMFDDGAGADVYYHGTASASGMLRTALGKQEATLWLDDATVAPGVTEVRIKRSLTYAGSTLSLSAQTYGGSAYDPFHYILSGATAKMFRGREGLGESCYVVRESFVTEAHPVHGGAGGSGLALIAIRSRVQVENLRVKASGYVPDWDGTHWADWTVTSNPAPHYADVLTGRLAADPLPWSLVDSAGLVAWRAACAANAYSCDMLVEGGSVDEVLTNLAACGYARPWAAESVGVIRDYDRSAEDPVQIFTPRNAANVSVAKGFARLPDAFRCKYIDGADDDNEAETIVWRPDRGAVDNPRFEEITYVGLVGQAAVEARAGFDFAQAVKRSAFYSWDAPAEAIVARRGDLVGLAHDALDRVHGGARIADVEYDGADIAAIVLDAEATVRNDPGFASLDGVASADGILSVGLATGIAIRQTGGALLTKAVAGPAGTRRRLEMATAFTPATTTDEFGATVPAVQPGNLVAIGDVSRQYDRFVLFSMTDRGDAVFALTAVPEAPDLPYPDFSE